MVIQVQLFSNLRECLPDDAQRGRASVHLHQGAVLSDLFEYLDMDRCLGAGRTFAEQVGSWQISVNGEFTQDLNLLLRDGDQVIVFPHMVGG